MTNTHLLAAGVVGCIGLAAIAIGGGRTPPPPPAPIVVVPGGTPVRSTLTIISATPNIAAVTPAFVEPQPIADRQAANAGYPGTNVNRTAPPDAPNGGIDGSTQDYAAAHPDFLAP